VPRTTIVGSGRKSASKGNVVDGVLSRAMQHYLARAALSASSMRGARKGTVEAARRFLGCLDRHEFGTTDEAHFRFKLDRTTDALRQTIPGY